jgi:hypothetical protein
MPSRQNFARKDFFNVQQRFSQWVSATNDKAIALAESMGHDIVTQAQIELVENDIFDTGALFHSGKVSPTTSSIGKTAKKVSVAVTFGGRTPVRGKNSPNGIVTYAASIHQLRHPFLLRAVQTIENKLKSKMASEFEIVARKGFGSQSQAAPGSGE